MSEEDVEAPRGPSTIQDRIAAFVMLDAMPDATVAQKTYRLALCGFPRPDIESILGISAGAVRQYIYLEKGKAKKKTSNSKPGSSEP